MYTSSCADNSLSLSLGLFWHIFLLFDTKNWFVAYTGSYICIVVVQSNFAIPNRLIKQSLTAINVVVVF